MLSLIGSIIMLVTVLVLVGIGIYAYRTIRNKVRNFSRMAFGTDSVMEGFQKTEQEYATTAKSVSSATSMCLPRIMRDFPQFHYDEMKGRAENLLVSYLRSLDAGSITLLTEGMQELKDQLSMQIQMYKSEGVRVNYDLIKIHRTEINQYRKQQGRCSIVFQMAVEYNYFKEKGGRIIDGNRSMKTQTRYNVECVYIQDRDFVENHSDASLGLNCPNCGAPLTNLGAKVCAYCDTPIVEFNIYSWNFSDVKEI